MLSKLGIRDKLTKMRREAEERDAKRMADKAKLPYLDLASVPINIEALALIPEDRAKSLKIAAIEVKDDKLGVVLCEPPSLAIQNLIKELELKSYKTSIFIVSLSSLNYALTFYKFVSKELGKITGKINISKEDDFKNKLTSIGGIKKALEAEFLTSGDVVGVLEMIFLGSVINRASDIHFEPVEKAVRLRLRIDGILHDVLEDLSHDFYLRLVSRLKLLSNLKINIHDEPQDGRFSINLLEKEIEARVAIAPSEFGEVVVMRLLDPAAISLTLADLGLREDDLKIIETELKRPNGLIINTGPTGSGKTTTLYAFLKHKKSPEIKIITVEDPIEYHLDGIEQTQVDEEAGYTFASGLRSLMRQDPDVILIGEMRDKETSEIGIQAALTGHLVFSTIHANSASGAIPRLIDIGVKPTSIGPALNLAIAQRLVRRLCQNCKMKQDINEDLMNKISKFLNNLPKRVKRENYKEIMVFKAKEGGCEKCNHSGYRGRIAIYELLLNDPEYEKLLIGGEAGKLSSHKDLEELIIGQAGESAIKKWAIENQGMVTMQQDGILKTISGITTIEEVEEITGTIVWN